jgi:hypothetical protein
MFTSHDFSDDAGKLSLLRNHLTTALLQALNTYTLQVLLSLIDVAQPRHSLAHEY